MASADDDAYALAYETGLRTLDEQARSLGEIRDRAGRLLTTATIAGGFVAGLILTSDQTPGSDPINTSWWMLAVAGFAAVVISAMYVWRPVNIRTTQNSNVLVSFFIEGDTPMTLAQAHRELALWFGDYADANRSKLQRARWAFAVSQVALLVEVAGLITTIGDAIHV